MINFVLVFVLCFGVAMLSDKLPFLKLLKEIISLGNRVFNIFQSKTSSDYRKERLMKWYSLHLFFASIKIIFFVLIIFLGAFLILLFFSGFILPPDSNIFQYVITFQCGIVSVLAFIFYYLFKKAYAKFRL